MAFFRAVKSPETPRSYLPKLAEPPPPEEREGKIVPRYVEIPALREHGFGPRNLFWGVITLVLALIFLVAALFFAGPKATLFLATALLTFTALFVLSRMHVFRQRNGGFLALATVCLLGTLVPLVETGFEALKHVTILTSGGTGTASVAASGEPPVLTQAFALSKPEGPGKQIKVLKDSRVTIGDRPYLIKAGDTFPFIEEKGNETTFAVRDLHISLPANVTEVIDPNAIAQGVTAKSAPAEAVAPATPSSPAPPSAEDLAAITISAQKEAIRLYPALGIKDSMENSVYISTYQQLRESGSTEFFKNPEWPIELADLLAKREGWSRGGAPSTTGPAPVLDAPSGNGLPPVDKLDAGDGLPQTDRGAR